MREHPTDTWRQQGVSLVLRRSVVQGNAARTHGGGIANGNTATLFRSIVRKDTAGTVGGGISNWGTATLRRSSWVTANSAGKSGGGIWNDGDRDFGGTVIVLGGSSVTGNTPDECFGTTAC